MKVAKSELMFSTPTLAKIAVKAANPAERSAHACQLLVISGLQILTPDCADDPVGGFGSVHLNSFLPAAAASRPRRGLFALSALRDPSPIGGTSISCEFILDKIIGIIPYKITSLAEGRLPEAFGGWSEVRSLRA